jgi:hypothetical protein
LREAEGEEIIITCDGKLAGLLIGFQSIIGSKTTRALLRRIARAQKSLRSGRAASGSRISSKDFTIGHQVNCHRNPTLPECSAPIPAVGQYDPGTTSARELDEPRTATLSGTANRLSGSRPRNWI